MPRRKRVTPKVAEFLEQHSVARQLSLGERHFLAKTFFGRKRALEFLLNNRSIDEIRSLIAKIRSGEKKGETIARNLARKNPKSKRPRRSR